MTALEILKGNLLSLQRESGRLHEKILYEFSELARELYAETGDELFGEETAALFRRSRAFLHEQTRTLSEAPSEYLPLLAQQSAATDSFMLAALSLFFSERVQKEHGDAFPWEERKTGARIAYVPVGSAEEAYFALASKREDAAVLYAESTKGAVEHVLTGRADYALLPYASVDGEPLSGVSRLLTGEELFLAAIVFVPREEGRLTYALLSSVPAPFVFSENMRLTLRLTAEDHAHLGRMLAALPTLGYEQTDFLPEREEYGRVCGRVSLTGGGDAIALWSYFSFYSVGFSYLGRYPLIEL